MAMIASNGAVEELAVVGVGGGWDCDCDGDTDGGCEVVCCRVRSSVEADAPSRSPAERRLVSPPREVEVVADWVWDAAYTLGCGGKSE